MRFQEEGREWRMPGLLYADDLVLCGESGEDLKAIVGRFIEVCMRRGLKANSGQSKGDIRWGGGVKVSGLRNRDTLRARLGI